MIKQLAIANTVESMLGSRWKEELIKQELFENIDLLVISQSVKPTSAYRLGREISDRFDLPMCYTKIHTVVNNLLRNKHAIRWIDGYKKMFMSPEEEYFTASVEAMRRVLNLAAYAPVVPNVTGEQMESGTMKTLLKKHARNKGKLLSLSSLLNGPNHFYAVVDRIENGLGISLKSVSQLYMNDLDFLMKNDLIKFANPECLCCGKPAGWGFDQKSGRPRLMYDITPEGEKYFFTHLAVATGVFNYLADSYIAQKENSIDLHTALEKPKTSKPYVIQL